LCCDLGGFGGKEDQREQSEGTVSHHDQALGISPALRDGFHQELVQLMRSLHVEVRDVADRLQNGAIKRGPQRGHFALRWVAFKASCAKFDWPIFRYGPHETFPAAEIE